MENKSVKNAMKHPDIYGAGAKKRAHLSPENKVKANIAEFERGTLYSGSGHKVNNIKQAEAIGYSEARKRKGDLKEATTTKKDMSYSVGLANERKDK